MSAGTWGTVSLLSFGPHGSATRIGAGGLGRPALGGVPTGGIDRAGVVSLCWAGQAGAGRGPGRRGQDRARQGARALSGPPPGAAAVLRGPRRGEGAVR